MSQVAEFWNRVKQVEARIVQQILNGELPGQPEPELLPDPVTEIPVRTVTGVYVTSLDSFIGRTSAGLTCAVTPRLAATRIMEGTHRGRSGSTAGQDSRDRRSAQQRAPGSRRGRPAQGHPG